MTGLVVKNTGTWQTVLSDDGTLETCTVKGNFRIKGIRSTSPVVIGDRVEFADGMITAVADRKNYIVRKSINLSKQSHILAANLDLCVLIVTVNHPITTTTFIDRFLANAEAYDIPAILVFNKIDAYDQDDNKTLSSLISLYESIGYKCIPISAEQNIGIDALQDALAGQIALLSGHSGVGKTTIINRLIPGINLRTADISDAFDTGKHTTTYSEMYPLNDGFIIDTPGIKGFGTFDMDKEDISDYFKEIFTYSQTCKFNNCTHTHEPGCAVIEAVENHLISQSRYISYLSMLNDKEESKYR
ncbi:MAG: ribosome small subunit-dependent GTPase A [Prevotellaceae bacterium]|nr:ribosome small subunit-dependent GTPase A [Candidatus Colivivens equi]MCQ2075645.1 ribosome small subunit-dependent GTPase A [Bacteroidaceae bacterium]